MASVPLADDAVAELKATGLRSAQVSSVVHPASGEPETPGRSPDGIVRLLTELGLHLPRARRLAAQCTAGAVLVIVQTSELTTRRMAEVTFAKYGAESTLLRAS